ncbi:Pkinase-domain-containing protein [Hygrophoropsis aurantiaca]|uniref:Pkinase-domain-containing protein n=1 Tax=Hygrophoropsis aurantiaca TaxID=72124 RepID=A0ACB8A2K0_9AGAM|nr:Pkinase-domain-containing protein [Hygrophoropsis aurantiaca]
MDNLQIPDTSFPGPSRQYGASRPVSVSVQPSPASPNQSASRRQRASHTVVSSQQQQQQQAEDQPAYRDVYSHPAAVAYTAAHPRRTIPKFGPYLLLQTLGEGEFGKVKLGLHSQWGEEVAVKLIRRGNIDTSVRMSKVEREIEVLRTLKHPNIVRLYDVIETDKYIGIILEYASGGELFDHILAHRYLKEKDAAKLFSQLISGVWYIHQKKIVHRDLKLENLLLDRHRNVIITDFGFANRFEHRTDDLMQTSCGSPCYAAPELVISEGLYVGSAVDIWSCGVILYAMLAGYLPFDDDPANPDGDNINLLYKYIVNTPLSFPEYVSQEARDLLSMMLVPDPVRRADLRSIMNHPWLAAYSYMFAKGVDDLERAAMEQHQMKRLAYQKQMRQTTTTTADPGKVARTQSARVDGILNASTTSAPRSHSYRDQQSPGQPEYLYETSVDQSFYSSPASATPASVSRKGPSPAVIGPSHVADDDPFGPPPSQGVNIPVTVSQPDQQPTTSRSSKENSSQAGSRAGAPLSVQTSPEGGKKKDGFRHTIQVEYGEQRPAPGLAPGFGHAVKTATPIKESLLPPSRVSEEQDNLSPEHASTYQNGSSPAREREKTPQKVMIDAERSSVRPLPPPPSTPPSSSHSQPTQLSISTLRGTQAQTPTVAVAPASPPANIEDKSFQSATTRTGSTTSATSSRHRKGLSVDKFGLGKIFGSNGEQSAANGSSSRVPSESSASYIAEEKRQTSTQHSAADAPQSQSKASLLSPASSDAASASKKNRRNTLTVMIDPIRSTMKSRSKGKTPTPTGDTPTKEDKEKKSPPSAYVPPVQPQRATAVFPRVEPASHANEMPASTTKARNVMQWFRRRSTTTKPGNELYDGVDTGSRGTDYSPQNQTPNLKADTATAEKTVNGDQPRSPIPTVSGAFKANRMFNYAAPNKDVLRIHHGAVDQDTITTRPPPEVIKHVCEVLEGMGIEFKAESEYKYRCIRTKKKKTGTGVGLGFSTVGSGNGLAAFTIVGSAASNGVDKRGLPVPSQSSTGGMLKGLLMRRQSSQVSGMASSQPSLSLDDDAAAAAAASPTESSSSPSGTVETVYGDTTQDLGDEVRFSVELTRIDRLKDTYSLDIRRLKGNLRSYKFLYDTLRERADLQR